jgi:energy-coupling factor transport system permease protein
VARVSRVRWLSRIDQGVAPESATAGRVGGSGGARALHPAAWWAWAIGLAVAATRTTNPLILGLLVVTICLVVALRRTETPWGRAFRMYLILGAVIVIVRTGFRVVFAGGGPTILFTLPRLDPLGALGGVALGGPVSAEALASGFYGGLQLATVIACVGAANALANPKRLLVSLPGALEELGAILVVAVSVFPQLAESVVRVNRARALRSEPPGRRHVLRTVLMPVLVDALDRSIELAAAMDARGYGRRAATTPSQRRTTSVILVAAVLTLSISAYALLDTGGTPAWLGAILFTGGAGIAAVGLRLAGRRALRSRHRPDRWGWPEWSALASGAVVAACLTWWARTDPALIHPVPAPGVWPTLTPPVVLAVLAAALPGVLTPSPGTARQDAAPVLILAAFRYARALLHPGKRGRAPLLHASLRTPLHSPTPAGADSEFPGQSPDQPRQSHPEPTFQPLCGDAGSAQSPPADPRHTGTSARAASPPQPLASAQSLVPAQRDVPAESLVPAQPHAPVHPAASTEVPLAASPHQPLAPAQDFVSARPHVPGPPGASPEVPRAAGPPQPLASPQHLASAQPHAPVPPAAPSEVPRAADPPQPLASPHQPPASSQPSPAPPSPLAAAPRKGKA